MTHEIRKNEYFQAGIGGCWWHDHGKGEHAHIWIGLGRRYIAVTFERRRHNNHWKEWEALLDERRGK